MPSLVHRSRILPVVAVVAALAASLAVTPPVAAAATFVVDTVSDEAALSACSAAPDDCSLRGAVASANVTAGADTIEFDIPSAQCPGGVCRITLTDGAFDITEAVTIDATTQPQHSATQANVCATATDPSHMRIELLPAAAAPSGSGFGISHSGGSVIKGFAIGTNDVGGSAVSMNNGSGHHIACNHFGLDAAGSATLGSQSLFSGRVWVGGFASNVTVGTNGDGVDDAAERNVFGPGGKAIAIDDSESNTIAGNYIGFSADGGTQVGAGLVEVREDSSYTVIGTNGDGTSDELERNFFGSYTSIWLMSRDNVINNRIAGNSFGVRPDGAPAPLHFAIQITDLESGSTGYEVTDNTFIATDVGLYIAGLFEDASVLVEGNEFGVAPDGSIVPNDVAIVIDYTGSNVIRSNVIAGSTTTGLEATTLGPGSVNNCLLGNTAGMVGTSHDPLPFEDNWWGAVDGPSGEGPGSGDSVSTDVDFAPWLTNPPAVCNTAPTVDDAVFMVNAGAEPGSSIGTPAYSDDGADLTFTIMAGDPDGIFSIGTGTGEITMEDTPDYPTLTSYDLTVHVVDAGSLDDDASVTIDITNHVPVAANVVFVVAEDALVGTSVGTVSATDDDGDDLDFSIDSGDPTGVLAIDSAGLITVAGPLDYKTTPSYSVVVAVSDGFESATATVTITVAKPNSPPVAVDAAFSIAEDATVGTEVGTVQATDDDDDDLDYTISAGDPGSVFAIDGDGLVTVAGSLDFETAPSYVLTVEVSDGIESDTVAVTVAVTDVYETPTTPTFGDVSVDHMFYADIEWLATAGVTKGCNPPGNDLFCSDASVTRGQMAAFLHRALAGTLPAGPTPDFTDADKSVFTADIEWLGAVGVTKGCNPPVNDQFCPDQVVTRQQMAAFLVRALGYSAGAGSNQFRDDDGSIFEANIERLAQAGVTRGCNPPTNDLFCPTAPVTRGQMAAFLHRALGR